MARLRENVSLKSLNTFGLDVAARWFMTLDSEQETLEFLMDNLHQNQPFMVLGGGSNVLFRHDYPGLILHNQILGKEVVDETEDFVWLKVGAGEVWHELVLYTLSQNWGGLQNLSLIPGSVGAAPIQNIGAYGVELKDVFHSLEALHIGTGAAHEIDHTSCQFGYRDSIFKRKAKGQYIIISVTLKLEKKPQLNTSYGAIKAELEQMGVEPGIHTISQAVIRIRQNKLPDPAQIGNSGSFFKNPVVPLSVLQAIQERYEQVPHYPVSQDDVKLPAGWLIEKCGWKGYRRDNYGVHDRQALVLVNHGGASGDDIYQLSSEILQSVSDQFGIQLEREVNVIG